MSPTDIISNVPKKFDDALQAGDVSFFPSVITKQEDSGVEVCQSSFDLHPNGLEMLNCQIIV